jgi:hypothetical protein
MPENMPAMSRSPRASIIMRAGIPRTQIVAHRDGAAREARTSRARRGSQAARGAGRKGPTAPARVEPRCRPTVVTRPVISASVLVRLLTAYGFCCCCRTHSATSGGASITNLTATGSPSSPVTSTRSQAAVGDAGAAGQPLAGTLVVAGAEAGPGGRALRRKQLEVACRHITCPKLTGADRAILVLLARLPPTWRATVLLVRPETILRWYRQGFKLLWRRLVIIVSDTSQLLPV